MYKIGIGHDSHMFEESEGKPLVLGGKIIKDHVGIMSHSDGDLIIHSIFNAVSSALGNKSLGHYHPDTDLDKVGQDSKRFFETLNKMLSEKGFRVGNLSIAIECKTPKIEPYVDDMKKNLAGLLNIKVDQIGITATTGEGLTVFGQGKGIQVFSIVSLIKC